MPSCIVINTITLFPYNFFFLKKYLPDSLTRHFQLDMLAYDWFTVPLIVLFEIQKLEVLLSLWHIDFCGIRNCVTCSFLIT